MVAMSSHLSSILKDVPVENMLTLYPSVALTDMGKSLFKPPDGGYYEAVWVMEDSTQSGRQQGPETSVLVEQKVRPEAFPSDLPMSVWSKKFMQYLGLQSGVRICIL
jgi:hypothetical protein